MKDNNDDDDDDKQKVKGEEGIYSKNRIRLIMIIIKDQD